MTKNNQEITIDSAVRALSCVQYGRIIYISTPVTGGPLVLSNAYSTKDALIAKNVLLSEDFSKKVLDMTSAPVINPARFMMHNWSQNAYITMWNQVIASIATEVWFNNGWEYSNGCAQEYLQSVEHGIKIFDADGKELCICDAIQLLSHAVSALKASHISVLSLKNVLKRLVTINQSEPTREHNV